jgi:hypothetical protein
MLQEYFMTGTKPWYQSITINSETLRIILVVLAFLGIKFDPDVEKAIIDAGLEIWAAVGSLTLIVQSVISIYGRFRAHQKIGPKKSLT